MEELTTWSKEKDESLEKLKELWRKTEADVQRRFLMDYINSNFRMYEYPEKNINPFTPCGSCSEIDLLDRCIGCQYVPENTAF